MVVSFAVDLWVVTYPTLFPQERCVTTLKTAAQETSHQFSDHVIEIFRLGVRGGIQVKDEIQIKVLPRNLNKYTPQTRQTSQHCYSVYGRRLSLFPIPK